VLLTKYIKTVGFFAISDVLDCRNISVQPFHGGNHAKKGPTALQNHKLGKI